MGVFGESVVRLGSLSRAAACPETTLQVLAAAGCVCVRTWRQTPQCGHLLSSRAATNTTSPNNLAPTVTEKKR